MLSLILWLPFIGFLGGSFCGRHMRRRIVFIFFGILLYPQSLFCDIGYVANDTFAICWPSFVLLDWDFVAGLLVHYGVVLIGLLGLYDFFSDKDKKKKSIVPGGLGEDKPVFEDFDLDFDIDSEDTVEKDPVEEDSKKKNPDVKEDLTGDKKNPVPKEDPADDNTNPGSKGTSPDEKKVPVEKDPADGIKGDLVLVPEGKTLPEAILDGLKGAIEWLVGKGKKLLGLEPRESLTLLIIIRVLVKLVVKTILTAGSVWLSYYMFLSPFFIYLVKFHEALCIACKLDVMSILSQLWGWQGAYLFFGAAHTIPILVGICVFYHLNKFLQS